MHFVTSVISALLVLAGPGLSKPVIRALLATDQPLEITNLTIKDSTKGNSSVSFVVYNPDPLTNATATCSATWAHNSTGYPPGTYQACGNSGFGWNMASFTSITDFTLGIEDSFIDPSVGEPPYDQVTIFGRAPINSTVLSCNGTAYMKCEQNEPKTIYAPIYATIAKKKRTVH